MLLIQGVPKKITTLRFAQYLRNHWMELQIFFFSLKLRSVQKFWIQNQFWPIPGGWDISETKWVSSTQKFIIILTCNKPDSLKMTSSCPERPLIDPDWTWKIPSVPEKPSIAPNGRMVLKSCSFQSYFKIS